MHTGIQQMCAESNLHCKAQDTGCQTAVNMTAEMKTVFWLENSLFDLLHHAFCQEHYSRKAGCKQWEYIMWLYMHLYKHTASLNASVQEQIQPVYLYTWHLAKRIRRLQGSSFKKKVIFYPLYYTSSAHIDKKCDLTNEAFNKIVNSTYKKSVSVLFSPHFFLTYF